MQEIKISIKKKPEKNKQEKICEDEEKDEKVRIHKKITIKYNDYDKLKESFDLINMNSINQTLKEQPLIVPKILQKKFEELRQRKYKPKRFKRFFKTNNRIKISIRYNTNS